MLGEVCLRLIKNHNRGLKEALVEFKSEEKGYTANVDHALVCQENRSVLYSNDHLKLRVFYVHFINAIGFTKSNVIFILERKREGVSK